MKKEHEDAQLLRWIAAGEEIDRLRNCEIAGWEPVNSRTLLIDIANGVVLPLNRYRIKPKTIRIGAFDVPEPMRTEPAIDSVFWEVSTDGISRHTCRGSFAYLASFNNGLLQTTQEGAEAMRNALLSLTKAPT